VKESHQRGGRKEGEIEKTGHKRGLKKKKLLFGRLELAQREPRGRKDHVVSHMTYKQKRASTKKRKYGRSAMIRQSNEVRESRLKGRGPRLVDKRSMKKTEPGQLHPPMMGVRVKRSLMGNAASIDKKRAVSGRGTSWRRSQQAGGECGGRESGEQVGVRNSISLGAASKRLRKLGQVAQRV